MNYQEQFCRRQRANKCPWRKEDQPAERIIKQIERAGFKSTKHSIFRIHTKFIIIIHHCQYGNPSILAISSLYLYRIMLIQKTNYLAHPMLCSA